MGLEEYKGVYIYAQQVDNKLSDIAFELVGKAKELAADLNTEVTAVLLGSNVKALATELGEYGADKVIVVDNPALETYRTEPYAQALVSVINEYKPEIMLVGATAIGRDLGPTVSARVKTGLTADCTKLEIGDFPINAMPGQEQKHNQLLMTLSVETQSQQSLVLTTVHRWQQFVLVLCRSFLKRLAEQQRLSSSILHSRRTIVMLRSWISLRQLAT